MIQDLVLRINLGGSDARIYHPRVIEYFGGSDIPRKSCKVFLDYGCYGHIPNELSKSALFQALRTLTGFKDLTIQISKSRHSTVDIPKSNRDWYDSVLRALNFALGPGSYQINEPDCCLELHPLAFVSQASGSHQGLKPDRRFEFQPLAFVS